MLSFQNYFSFVHLTLNFRALIMWYKAFTRIPSLLISRRSFVHPLKIRRLTTATCQPEVRPKDPRPPASRSRTLRFLELVEFPVQSNICDCFYFFDDSPTYKSDLGNVWTHPGSYLRGAGGAPPYSMNFFFKTI